jgi:hypothetical protein
VPAPVVEGEPAGTTASATSPAIRRQAPAVAATSKLELVYRNRLKNAELSVFVDGRRAYRGSVASEAGFFSRAVGKNVWAAIDLTPGEHVVDVRITGAEGKLDLVRQTSARFEDGRTHRLRVSVSPFKKLRLAWKESPGG